MKHEYIPKALNSYNQTNRTQKFSVIDALILDTILSKAYTTDRHLASCFMCSERTVKRSINKLCDFGFVIKHLAADHTKTLTPQQDVINNFMSKYQVGDT